MDMGKAMARDPLGAGVEGATLVMKIQPTVQEIEVTSRARICFYIIPDQRRSLDSLSSPPSTSFSPATGRVFALSFDRAPF